MTFLSPAYLWLLPLLSVPIIIHLLAKRKSKLIDFPSLKFLKLLEQDALRKFNLKQLLLLILRTLMVLLIILAFSRPTLNLGSSAVLQLGSSNLALIILDNTASTLDEFDKISTPLVDELAEKLAEKGYQVHFCDLTTLSLGGDHDQIRGGYGTAYQGDVLNRIGDQIDLDRFADKVLIWMGDGQHAREMTASLLDWDIYLHTLPVTRDFAIADMELPHSGPQLGQDVSISIMLSNGPEDDNDQTLELLLNEERQNQRIIEPGAGSVVMTAQIKESGFQLGKIKLGEDAFPYNDLRSFVIPTQGKIPLQILRTPRGVDYWAVIASSLEKLSVNLDLRLIDTDDVDELDLSRGGSVIIEDAALLADYTWSRLRGFLERGGQLVLFGNGGAELLDLLNFSKGLQEQSYESSLLLYMTDAGRQVLNMAPFEKVISEGRLKIFKRYATGSNELRSTWIRFADDQPFLGSQDYGSGRIVWFNTEFGGFSSNLPLLGVFPTLIMRLGQSVQNTDQTSAYNYMIGDTINFILESADRTEPYGIMRPNGTMDYAAPDSSYALTYSNTDIPGIYQLQRGRQVIQPVAVNIAPEEASAHGDIYIFDEDRLYHTQNANALMQEVLENRTGIALWPLLLLLVMVVWMIETYLSRIRNTWRQND